MCGCFFFSRAGLVNHLCRMGQEGINQLVRCFPPRPPQHICPTCGLACKSADVLTRHSKIHKDLFQLMTLKDGQFKWHVCKQWSKAEGVSKSHVCAHCHALINEEIVFFWQEGAIIIYIYIYKVQGCRTTSVVVQKHGKPTGNVGTLSLC